VAQHLTEEEQIEKLKRWWVDYGRSVLIGVVLAVVGYFGWQSWQGQRQEARESASVLYEELTEIVVTPPGETLSEERRAKAATIAAELKSEHSNLLYASHAALLMARVAVEQGDLAQAEQELSWLLEQDPSEALGLLARWRLAQVLYGQGEYERALATLDTVKPGAYAAGYAELRGDIFVAQGQLADGKAAYQTALNELLPAQNTRRDIIQMKLDAIQVDDVSPSTQADAEGTVEALIEAPSPAATVKENDN
jgi:predicted negative regulator of RcsB-dependent stress response